MGITHFITANGSSAVTQFIDLVLSQQDLLDQAASRDAEAIRILTSPALPEAIGLSQRQSIAKQLGRRARKIWTRRDERRLALIKGWRQGWCAPCRIDKLLSRFGNRHVLAYRKAMEELRQDGTAAAVSPKLALVKSEHDALLERARILGQRCEIPLPRWVEFSESYATAVSDLVDETRPPAPAIDGPVPGNRWRYAGRISDSEMQRAAWRMVAFLWTADGKAASFDELRTPIYDDPEHEADANAFGSLRRAANIFFAAEKIPLKVSTKKDSVRLEQN